MADLFQYKCPNCGGALEFDSNAQSVKCPYCDSLFSASFFQETDQGLENGQEGPDGQALEQAYGTTWEAGEQEGLLVYVCKSCGGEIIGDENMAATRCPYCDSPVIISGNFTGSLKPDYVIPFQFSKEEAKSKLIQHFAGKKLMPASFKTEHKIDEIKGIYVPYWLYDGNVNGDALFEGTRVRHWSDSKYDYTETSYYDIYTSGELDVFHVPADGSSKMPDTLMESLEPFPGNKLENFQTAYLAGFLADKYDVTDEDNYPRVRERSVNSLTAALRNQISGYNTVSLRSRNMRFSGTKVHYALYPVWILHASWRGKPYTFAMNGATGKFVGDLPCDVKKAIWKTLLNWLIFATLIGGIVLFLMMNR